MAIKKYNSPTFVSDVLSLRGRLPNFSNGSISSTLTEWNEFKNKIEFVSNAGNLYDSPLPVFTYANYASVFPNATVLDYNNAIHLFGTGNTAIKISPNRTIVTTYSLLTSGYYGSVLSPNGDIHLVPWTATVGQKIAPSGVVSTYTILHARNAAGVGAYRGGVLDPNGDIHFVPSGIALVGQKVSSAGVVSTYSIARTGPTNSQSVGYRGGVLAPNGDIHFIPYFSRIGQKVSAQGVVSTYSLLTSASRGSSSFDGGGVVDFDGNIHFFPTFVTNNTAGQNQQITVEKISISGVSSTYSFTSPYPAGHSATLKSSFVDGLGNIHLISDYAYGNIIRGVKINKNGIASSYLLSSNTDYTQRFGIALPEGTFLTAGFLVSNNATYISLYNTTSIKSQDLLVCNSPFFNNNNIG